MWEGKPHRYNPSCTIQVLLLYWQNSQHQNKKVFLLRLAEVWYSYNNVANHLPGCSGILQNRLVPDRMQPGI